MNSAHRWLPVATLAIEICVAPPAGVFVGNVLDRRYGWDPWGMILGALLGLVMSFVLLRELVRRMKQNGGA